MEIRIEQLMAISEVLEKVEGLIWQGVHEDVIEKLSNPFYEVLSSNGVKLDDSDY